MKIRVLRLCSILRYAKYPSCAENFYVNALPPVNRVFLQEEAPAQKKCVLQLSFLCQNNRVSARHFLRIPSRGQFRMDLADQM